MTDQPSDFPDISLNKVRLYDWLLLVVMSLAGWLAFSTEIAQAIFVGSLIACVSFELMKRDLTRLMQGPLTAVKGRFLIKYYARLSVLVAILFCTVKYGALNIGGLLAGLSTVLFSIGINVAPETKRIFFNLEEAS